MAGFFETWDSLGYTAIVLGLLAVLGAWVYLESQFKNRVRLKEIVRGRTIIRNYRAKYYEDKIDKSAWWRLAGEKRRTHRLIPVPPEEAIDIDNKGKKYVEGYRFETGEIVFIKDDWNVARLPDFDTPPEEVAKEIEKEDDYQKKKEILDNWRKKAIADFKKENKVISPYQPVTTNQRMGYFANIKKAESRKGFDWKQQLLPITAIGGIVIIVLAIIVMWGEIAQPLLEADKISENNIRMQREIVQILEDIKTNQQTITNKVTDIENQQPPD